MKPFKSIIYIIFVIIFSHCSILKQRPKGDEKIDFTFLQLNDVYEIAPIQGGAFGGMARVATLHKELLKENPNTMLFLAGDFLNPSLLGTLKIDGERVRGKQMVEVMNAMNFDLVAFGNHEFDLSQKDLQKRLNESTFPWVSANVKLKTKEAAMPFYKDKEGEKEYVGETFIKEISDADGTTIKIGFISVCIPSNPKDYVEYANMFVKARASYAYLKDKVDVIFGLTHVKINHDRKIAQLIPDLPLIMGGHEHTNKYEKIGDVTIAKADANAKSVYVHKISFDKKTKKTTVQSELKEINASIEPNIEVDKVVQKWQSVLNRQLKEVIAKPNEVIFNAKVPLDGRDTPIRSQQTNLGEIITAAMSFAFNGNVDAALVNGGSIRIDDQLYGNITAVDIFKVLPYGGAILKVELTGELLKRVLDYGKLAKGTGAYLQRHNISLQNNRWLVNGKSIEPNKKYTVAFSDYLLKGYDIPFLSNTNTNVLSVYTPSTEEFGYDIRKSVVEYFKYINN